jgi:hypothetical protein
MEARSGPTYKTWSEEEGALKAQHAGRGCYVKFKFVIWLATVAVLVSLRRRLGARCTLLALNRRLPGLDWDVLQLAAQLARP